MKKVESRVEVAIHDGVSGLTPPVGPGFDFVAWPIDQTIASGAADDWLMHLHAEVEDRGCPMTMTSQLERAETNGSVVLAATVAR